VIFFFVYFHHTILHSRIFALLFLGVPKVSKKILCVEYCVENILLYLYVYYKCFRCMTSLCKKHEKMIFIYLKRSKTTRKRQKVDF